MSLCLKCATRWEADLQNRQTVSDFCDMCEASMKEEERKSGTQMKMTFPTSLRTHPKFPHLVIKSSGLIVKKKYDSALAKPQPSSKGSDNEKLANFYNAFNDSFGLGVDGPV